MLIGIGMTETRCKVCSSPNKHYYEKLYYKAKGKVSFTRFEKLASDRGENISRKSFTRHFRDLEHYTPERITKLLQQGKLDEKVEEAKTEAINILDEIRNNLMGLKALIEKAKKSKNLQEVVAVYREHRLTLQDIERLRNRLSSDTALTKAELYQEIFWACSQLCPKCQRKFWVKLDERLKHKGFT